MVDKFSRKTRSKIMSQIKSKDTEIERLLRKSLWDKGFRYKLHCDLLGKPDVVFLKKKVVIFVDGDFWHGYNWKKLNRVPPKGYWQKKIMRTIARDRANTKALRKQGWTVLRFWEHTVKEDLDKCVDRVLEHLKSRNIYKTARA